MLIYFVDRWCSNVNLNGWIAWHKYKICLFALGLHQWFIEAALLVLGIEELFQRLSSTKQSFTLINLDILYLPSVRVGGDPLLRIWWWSLIWKARCVPLSSQSRWGMSLPAYLVPASFLIVPFSCWGGQGTASGTFSRGEKLRRVWLLRKGFFVSLFFQARLNCKHCGKPVIDVRIGMQYFSEYSNVQQCPHCGNLDYHFVKPFSSFKVLEAYWRKLCFSNSYFMGISSLLHIFL